MEFSLLVLEMILMFLCQEFKDTLSEKAGMYHERTFHR